MLPARNAQEAYGDYAPPDSHPRDSGQAARADIETLAVMEESLPARALRMVVEWGTLHRMELREALQKAAAWQKPPKIAPLP